MLSRGISSHGRSVRECGRSRGISSHGCPVPAREGERVPVSVQSEEEVVLEFRRVLDAAKDGWRRKVRLAVIDHITSMPSVVIPVKRFTKICREEGVDHVFVDGVHAIGSVEVDMEDIGADFYTSNLYKWFFCPPSAAFLYSRKSTCSTTSYVDLHHLVVSSEYGEGQPVEI